MSNLSIHSALTTLGFAEYETDCLLALARLKKTSAKRLSRELNITYNLTKVMLGSLVDRGLVQKIDTPDQDTYAFAGSETLTDYLKRESERITTAYQAAVDALQDYL